MARGFAGTNTQISGTTTVAKNLTNFSMAGWMRRPSAASIQGWGFNTSSIQHRTACLHFSDNNIYFVLSNGANSFASSSQNITGWNHWAIAFDGSQSTNATRLLLYVNGAAVTPSYNLTIPATTSNNAANESFTIGRVQANNAWSTGDFAELGMWQATLSSAEINSLAKGFACDKVRPQSLVYYTPLVREIQDLARGMTLTDASSTVEPHPRIYA
jgi:hypothetical protein